MFLGGAKLDSAKPDDAELYLGKISKAKHKGNSKRLTISKKRTATQLSSAESPKTYMESLVLCV